MVTPRTVASWILLGAAWTWAVAVGMNGAARYENTPGTVTAAPREWPAASGIARQPGRFTLVLFAHPECPCTRASLAELGNLLARPEMKGLDTVIEFRKPGMSVEEARRVPLWRTSTELPGAAAALDEDGRELRAFGATVSGQAMLYDPAGHLVFHGGLTVARGHEGNSAGVEAVGGLVLGRRESTALVRTPVFGCSLLTPAVMESSWTL